MSSSLTSLAFEKIEPTTQVQGHKWCEPKWKEDIPKAPKLDRSDSTPKPLPKPMTHAELDAKYPEPQNCGQFKIFFGKYKGRVFKDVLQDGSYLDFVMSLTPKSNNVYLLQRYIKAITKLMAS